MANMRKLSALAMLPLLAVGAFAQTATTTPVGFMRYAIEGGTLAAPVTTGIAIPLHDLAGVSGLGAGALSVVTAKTVTVNSAGWTAGVLADPAAPYALLIKSGVGAGSTLPITANTDSVLTLDVVDLVAKGVVAGDRFEIIAVDTLWTLFGQSLLTGGTAASSADVVYLLSPGGTWVGYYYNQTKGFWKRTTDPVALSTSRNNTPVMPGSGALIERKSAGTVELVITGTVPSSRFVTSVANSGNTLIHTGFPTDVTLGDLALQTKISGWVVAANAADADWLLVKNGTGSWSTYFYQGAFWRLTTVGLNKNTQVIPAGTPVLIFRKGTAIGYSDFARALPYSL